MAQYYIQFSSIVFESLTSDEKAFLERAVPLARRFMEMRGIDAYIEVSDNVLVFGYSHLDQVVNLLRMFMRKFRPMDVKTIGYARTDNKMTPDTLGGGFVTFSSYAVRWVDTGDMIPRVEQHMKNMCPPAIVMMANGARELL